MKEFCTFKEKGEKKDTFKSVAVKYYPYYMIFLRHRYSKEREDNSFPQEIFKLLEKENKDIEKIYKYCKA